MSGFTSGQSYAVSAWVRVSGSGTATLRLNDSGGTLLSGASVSGISSKVWEMISVSGTAPSSGTIQIDLHNDGAGTVYWDDVRTSAQASTFKQTRTFHYGSNGQLDYSTTPEKGTVNYYYKSNGFLDHKTDPKSQTLWYDYDSHNRLLDIKSGSTYSGATTMTTFTYDTGTNGVGKMASASNSGYTWSYGYDLMGRANTQNLQIPYAPYGGGSNLTITAGYTYDSDGKLTGMTYPGGLDTSTGTAYQYTYDIAGRATGLNVWNSSTWNTVTSNGAYNASGQLTGWTDNGINLTRGYDPARGWLTGITASCSKMNLGYSYNADGQVTAVTDTVNGGQAVTSYTYDSLNRLASATTNNWTLSWTYDEFGNRLTQSGSAASGQPTPPQPSFSYDSSTNRISNYGYQLWFS